jgi:multiple sugar transport system ATP-binding protein
MNVFPVRVERHNGALRMTIGDRTLAFPGLEWPDAGASAGIRPEAFALAKEGDDGALSATVEHVEFLGHETLVHAVAGELRLVARLDGMQPFTKGDRIALRIDPTHLHRFDRGGVAL